MKEVAIKSLIFIVVSSLGLLAYHVLTILSIKYGIFPDVSSISSVEAFKNIYWGGGMMVWIVGVLAAIGFFFTEGEKRQWFIGAPVYLPLFYMLAILTYYM